MRDLDDLDVVALRQLIDRQAIVDCIHRHARGVDRADPELLGSAYHHDAVEDHGGYVGDLQDMLAFISRAHRPFDRYQRYVTNTTVDVDGDEAHAESYWFCVLVGAEPGTVSLNGGRYVDRLKRRDAGWRIVDRVVVIEWSTTTDGVAPTTGVEPRLDRDDVSYQRPLRVSR